MGFQPASGGTLDNASEQSEVVGTVSEIDTAIAPPADAAVVHASAASTVPPDESAAAAERAAEVPFALWDKSDQAAGNRGTELLDEEDLFADGDDAAWQEMWAALHVPDPDDPDNNLYVEVKASCSRRCEIRL